jgi:hypothetical protein
MSRKAEATLGKIPITRAVLQKLHRFRAGLPVTARVPLHKRRAPLLRPVD